MRGPYGRTRPAHIARIGHLNVDGPSGPGLQQPDPRRLGDRRRSRAHPQLVSDVGHVAMDRMRADDELLGDLPVAEAARHQQQDLALARRQRPISELCGLRRLG